MISESEKSERSEKGDNKKRPRKKAFLGYILQQMEFYLSDANLARDRFFNNLMKKNKEIDIQVFLNCNRIRSLTTDQNDIVKALEKSEVLSVTEDRKRIFRKTDVSKKDNADLYTIYVEGFGPDMTMDRIKDMFQKYGKIDYISFPRFKTGSKQNKGFAFIEFVETDTVEKVIEVYTKKNAVFDITADPSNLNSVLTYEPETPTSMEVSSNKTSDLRDVSVKSLKSEPVRKKINSANVIRVARKTVWKKLRNKYLMEQRRIGNAVKNSTLRREKSPEETKIENEAEVVAIQNDETQRVVPIEVEENDSEPVTAQNAPVTSLDGFIVKFHLNDSEYDKKDVSKIIKASNEHIQFVDLKNKNPEGFLRFSGDITIARNYCESDLKNLSNGIFKSLELLNDTDRQEYLLNAQKEKRVRNAKIADRVRKRAKKPKPVVSKSIKFTDDESETCQDQVSSTTDTDKGDSDMVLENV